MLRGGGSIVADVGTESNLHVMLHGKSADYLVLTPDPRSIGSPVYATIHLRQLREHCWKL